MLLGGLALKGYAIKATDGTIGHVSDFLFHDTSWKIRWLVADTGNWLPGRKVLLHPSAVSGADHALRQISVTLSKAQVRGSPDISQDQPVSQMMQNGLYDYYGWDPLWGGGYYGPGAMASPLASSAPFGGMGAYAAHHPTAGDEADPHLRSIAAVTHYHIHAIDGQIGHVANMLLDDESWDIRYLIVDTSNWWAGREVLISPVAVQEIAWADRQIRLNITRAQIQASPPWDPAVLVDDEYTRELDQHYNWPGYGWQNPRLAQPSQNAHL